MLYYPQVVNFISVEEAYLFTSPAAAARDTAVKHIALITTNMVAQTFSCQWSELDLKSKYELKIKKNSYFKQQFNFFLGTGAFDACKRTDVKGCL